MQPFEVQHDSLSRLDGRDYGAFQSLTGEYGYPDFQLCITQIPKDPHAPPHTGIYRLRVSHTYLGIQEERFGSRHAGIAFRSPETLRVEVNLPHAGSISGLGIPRGVTLIVGGGYHGKSTLLHAVESGIYDHVPGDGRELCAADPLAVKVRAYSGRTVRSHRIDRSVQRIWGKKRLRHGKQSHSLRAHDHRFDRRRADRGAVADENHRPGSALPSRARTGTDYGAGSALYAGDRSERFGRVVALDIGQSCPGPRYGDRLCPQSSEHPANSPAVNCETHNTPCWGEGHAGHCGTPGYGEREQVQTMRSSTLRIRTRISRRS